MNIRKHVLVVEDDPLVAEIVLDSLGDEYDVRHAEDAAQAVSLLRERRPDLILLDCTLPGGLGEELVPAADAAGIRLLLMSGSPERAAQVPGRRAFILKPFALAALMETIADEISR